MKGTIPKSSTTNLLSILQISNGRRRVEIAVAKEAMAMGEAMDAATDVDVEGEGVAVRLRRATQTES